MARKKFRNSQRHVSSSERSFQEYVLNQPLSQTTRTELVRLIRAGEDTYLELKLKLSNSEKISQEIVALANTAGGTVVFGVTDQLLIQGVRYPGRVQEELVRICREEIVPPLVPLIDTVAFDNGKRIVALEVQGKNRPYRTANGKFYIRTGPEKREATREELSQLIDEARPLYYENIPLRGFKAEHFDDAVLWSFVGAFDANGSSSHGVYETKTVLKRDLLLAVGRGEDFVPTVAGVLLFGKDERIKSVLPAAGIEVTRYSGAYGSSEVVETKRLEGNLLSLYDSSLEFIEKYCDLFKHRLGKSKEQEEVVAPRPAYHLYSIKEALANLVMHRDLALREIPTTISIFDDSIQFENPRRTQGFVPPASRAIRFGITQRVNPQISSIFRRREYGVNIPQGGLPMILKQSELFSGKKAELYTTNDRFSLKINAG
ncbi:MAG: hypothetical protein HKN33_09015 [Pyrinomonadaceae bacterium]|nr:hypothetical protein [Pyrinomonadaceae bacterium]